MCNVNTGAIDAIINQIKGGRFSLKATDKEVRVKKKKNNILQITPCLYFTHSVFYDKVLISCLFLKQAPVKKQETPPVVNEMMNVLGTLRRNPKRRASFKTAPADVAL